MKNQTFFRFIAFMYLAFLVGSLTNSIGQAQCTVPYTFTVWNAISVLGVFSSIFWLAYVAGQEKEANY